MQKDKLGYMIKTFYLSIFQFIYLYLSIFLCLKTKMERGQEKEKEEEVGEKEEIKELKSAMITLS